MNMNIFWQPLLRITLLSSFAEARILLQVLAVRHTAMLVGHTCGGKSVVLHTLAKAQTRLGMKTTLHVINPKVRCRFGGPPGGGGLPCHQKAVDFALCFYFVRCLRGLYVHRLNAVLPMMAKIVTPQARLGNALSVADVPPTGVQRDC